MPGTTVGVEMIERMRNRPETVARRRLGIPVLFAVLAAVSLLGAACTAEDATPIDPANPPDFEDDPGDLTDVTHVLEPTPQMQELAEQQCLDDPELAEGLVQAVDPDTDAVVSEIRVDCADVRSSG